MTTHAMTVTLDAEEAWLLLWSLLDADPAHLAVQRGMDVGEAQKRLADLHVRVADAQRSAAGIPFAIDGQGNVGWYPPIPDLPHTTIVEAQEPPDVE